MQRKSPPSPPGLCLLLRGEDVSRRKGVEGEREASVLRIESQGE